MKVVHLSLASVLLFTALVAAAASSKHVEGKVEAVAPSYGNVDTSFSTGDLATLGVKRGDTFQVGFAGKRFDVYLGDTYSDVPKGDWVAFITAKGKLRIARNLDDAATALGVKKGDTITLYH